MDQYFRTSADVDTKDLNFDHPNHLDLELLTQHLAELAQGRAVKTPSYDFAKREQSPERIDIRPVPVIIISGHGNIETAVAAIKRGAYEYIEKPFNADRLILVVGRALEASRLRRENEELKGRTGADVVRESRFAPQQSEVAAVSRNAEAAPFVQLLAVEGH